MKELLITICARGGSKGIPGKNIKPLNGKPLIAYTIEIASKLCENVAGGCVIALSTDSPEIKQVAQDFGLSTKYERPAHLATDEAGKLDAIQDILIHQEKLLGTSFRYVLDLDVTSPLRTLQDLEESFKMLKENPDALNIFSVNPANRNPYFNMVEQKENGFYHLVKKSSDVLSRQAAPKVFDMNASFYFYRRAYFASGQRSSITDKSLIYVMPHVCFDLDEPLDYDFMEYTLKNNKLDFDIC